MNTMPACRCTHTPVRRHRTDTVDLQITVPQKEDPDRKSPESDLEVICWSDALFRIPLWGDGDRKINLEEWARALGG